MTRSAALGLLAAVAGCNQILGLDGAILLDAAPLADAAPPGEAPLPVAHLTWLVPVTDATGIPATPQLAPITPAPAVQIGRLGEALVDATYMPDGTISIPTSYLESPGAGWRLAYTIGSGVPRELQWAPTGEGRAIVPYFGGVGRSAAGTNASLALTPTGGPSYWGSVTAYTTGVWTERRAFSVMSPTVAYAYASALPMLGSHNAIERAKGDRVVLVNYTSLPAGQMGRRSTGTAIFEIDLVDGVSTAMPPPSWPAPATTRSVQFQNQGDAALRVAASVNKQVTTGIYYHYLVGLGPSVNVPQHIYEENGVPLASPVQIILLYDQTLAGNGDTDVFDTPATDLPRLATHKVVDVQTLPGGLMKAVGIVSTATSSGDIFMSDFSAAIVSEQIMLGATDLEPNAAATTDAVVAPGSGTFDLTFEHDESMGVAADFYEVTLHRVTMTGFTGLAPVRTYVVTDKKVEIDRALLQAGTRYVFELRATVGAPGAATGDFRQWTMPQSTSLLYSRTFVVQ